MEPYKQDQPDQLSDVEWSLDSGSEQDSGERASAWPSAIKVHVKLTARVRTI